MENVDITSKVKNFIRFGLAGLLILSGAIGYGVFKHYHAENILQIDGAKVTSNLISIHALTDSKITELTFADGDEVKQGDVIARVEVKVTEEDIKKLQQAVDAAKKNLDSLKLGQHVKTPVRRTKTVANPAPQTSTAPRSSASIATLEERAKRVDELYEMGAVSKTERDKAHADLAKAKSSGTSQTPAPSQSQTVEIEFIDSIQATPANVLQNAENAVKEAELALNVAIEQSKQTEIIAPADGVIYYNFAADEEVKAGDVIAKIGDDKNVWIEAEVSEEIFNQVPLGKKVNYTLDGKNLSGTVTEKTSVTLDPVDASDVTTEESAVPRTDVAEENNSEQPAETEKNDTEKVAEEQPAETPATEKPAEEVEEVTEPEEPEPPKYILKVSLPTERDFDLKLLAETTLTISN